jgi:putative heme-binding domain-containing protein
LKQLLKKFFYHHSFAPKNTTPIAKSFTPMKLPQLLPLLLAALTLNAEDGFQALFNGKDLSGWAGKEGFWTVKDGAIFGKTTKEKPTKGNTFLVWQGGEPGDFIFKTKVRFSGNNSGVQYRSELVGNPEDFVVKGYQADLHPNPEFFGMLYAEKWRGIVAKRFQKVEVGADGKAQVVGAMGDKEQKLVESEWNELTIVAVGDRQIHQINGVNTIDLKDNHPEAKRKGILALQLHAGGPMTVEFKDVRIRYLKGEDAKATIQAAINNTKKAPKAAAGKKKSASTSKHLDGAKWIWHAKPANSSASRLRKTFELAGETKEATLLVTCDNGAKIYLNGKHVGDNPDWSSPSKFDLIKLLQPGKNELLAEATNKDGIGGFIAVLVAKGGDGKELVIQSGADWEAAAPGTDSWKKAVVLDKYGEGPWGRIFEGGKGGGAGHGETLAAEDVNVPEGFQVEKLYNVPKLDQGSWVAMAIDQKGRLIACDQYGSLYRMALPAIGTTEGLQPEKLDIDLGKAHGLLVAFGSLYVMVNEDGSRNGLYRVTDSNGDDQYDKIELLHKISGGGEHGLHSMVVSPDGKRIFFNCGNASQLPDKFEKSRAPKLWGEDHILPRLWDGNGFMRGMKGRAGGYICSMNPDGSDLELFCHGFRNEFDICFDLGGQLFTYDADMEWDIGTPWYRFTRVNHCVSGADFGWHSGAGKWPDYYPDNLPTTIDIGPGSPTGVVSGMGAKFPAKYQRAIFINDWTYGTMWAIHLTPDGASYNAEKEDFINGKPLPLTDVVINPNDGAMYFAVGGRRTQSGVYRVTYVGDESTAPAQALPLGGEFQTRASLEKFHVEGADPKTVLAQAWPHLGHADRHVRHAARTAIELLPVEAWRAKALSETRPDAAIEAIIALARVSGEVTEAAGWPHEKTSSPPVAPAKPEDQALQSQLFESLGRVDFHKLSTQQQRALLRAYQLVITRLGKPTPDQCRKLTSRLEPAFPAEDPYVNRELCQLLVANDSKKVVFQTLVLMATADDHFQEVASEAVLSRNDGYASAARAATGSRPNSQQLSYIIALRNAKEGWTPGSRKTYFSWFPRVRAWKGGNSFRNTIENLRQEALANLAPKDEAAELEALSAKSETEAIANYVAPKGPGKTYTLDETVSLAQTGLTGRDFQNGKDMFNATACATCHRFNGDGGSIGPDLTGTGNRYTLRDLMENIITPSKVISDQYGSHQITKTDGSMVIGKIIVEEDGKLTLMTNPFAPLQQLSIPTSEIAKKEPHNISMMPPGLINSLNPDELLNLTAYLLSGGDSGHKMFKQ